MKEISDILKAYSNAAVTGKKTALATVVKVEGSSYRQPGARMLVIEDGELTGAISGGCLEGDALRKALLSIQQKQNKLITYDTSNEDDIEIGLQLGCNGIVHILFEFIDEQMPNNPIRLLQELEKERKAAVILTLFSIKKYTEQIGTILFYRDEDSFLYQNEKAFEMLPEAKKVLNNKTAVVKKTQEESQTEALFDYINPPTALIIAGAGNDVQPLVEIAVLMGWEVTIGDGRAAYATSKRFPKAKQVLAIKAAEFVKQTTIDAQTYFVLMTHNYKYDIEILKQLLETNCNYIGILGPKTKLERMLNDLSNEGVQLDEEKLNRIYGPIGLDIGAETAEEIALAVTAEIKAVMMGKKGGSLKYKPGKIHNTIIYGN